MDWREEYAKKLVTPDEAVREIKSGDIIILGHSSLAPFVLCQALGRRKDELEDVTIIHRLNIMPLPWFQPGYEKAFHLVAAFGTPLDRHLIAEGRMDTTPQDLFLTIRQYDEDRRPGNRLVFMRQVSPPDKHGYCSLGHMIWHGLDYIETADVVLAEVNPGLIRTYGENYVHVSQISKFVETEPSFELTHADVSKAIGFAVKDETETEVASVICSLVAAELVKDGDVLQTGVGAISGAMFAFLHNKHNLGLHSEVIAGGIIELVKEGVITGQTKKIDTGKVVASAITGLTEEEMAFVNMNPAFELRRATYVNDPRVISQNDHVVAINNALAVDLSGQIACDSLGPLLYSGAGGQFDFIVGALLSRGGRSVTVLPATAKGGRVSRITPTMARGQGVTVPRYLCDYVVTEYGIASLFGKTMKQRVHELVSIAHPDFRSGLRRAARRLGWL
jgi:acyl-CoA hydrolase